MQRRSALGLHFTERMKDFFLPVESLAPRRYLRRKAGNR
jgi:hypothetical protein